MMCCGQIVSEYCTVLFSEHIMSDKINAQHCVSTGQIVSVT